jgi:hypothetical protein
MKLTLLLALFCAFLLVSPSQAQEAVSNSGKVYWYGSVDNKIHLTIRGLTVEQKAVEGNATEPGRYSFTAPLPEAGVTVKVTKIEGRSNKITVVQQPSAGNNFTAIVEVHDDGGGSRDYFLEISWE